MNLNWSTKSTNDDLGDVIEGRGKWQMFNDYELEKLMEDLRIK
ncbi:hypothetical protein [Terrihalobacillus insolitus]|nr:hypothetical protein [Terrihalobacillus insolitus]